MDSIDQKIQLLRKRAARHLLNREKNTQRGVDTIFAEIDKVFESTKQKLREEINRNVEKYMDLPAHQTNLVLSEIEKERELLHAQIQQLPDNSTDNSSQFVETYEELERQIMSCETHQKSTKSLSTLKKMDVQAIFNIQETTQAFISSISKEITRYLKPSYPWNTFKCLEKYPPKSMMNLTSLNVNQFDYKTLEKTNRTLHGTGALTDDYSATVVTQDNRFFIAGSLVAPYLSTYEFVLPTNVMTPRANLNNPKWCSSLLEVKKDQIILIGGYLPVCEVYNVVLDTWTVIQPLNYDRWSPACFCIEEKCVYVYGGYVTINALPPVLNIEVLEVNEEMTNLWKVLDVKIPDTIFPVAYLTCFQLNDQEVLILGEKDSKLNPTTETVIFDLCTNKIRLSGLNLSKSDKFLGSSSTFSYKQNKGSIHYVMSKAGTLHILKNRKWIHIKGFAADS